MRVRIRRLAVGTMLSLSTTAALAGASASPAFAATSATIRTASVVNTRNAPSSTAPVTGRLGNRTKVTIECSVTGTYVRGYVRSTAQWDLLTTGSFVSHAYVVAASAVNACPASMGIASTETGPTGSMSRSEFIAASVAPAQRSQREFGVPASVTIAQAIIESGWGRSRLSANDNNFFGMKCFNRGPFAVGCHTYATSECKPDGTCYRTEASFRVYTTAADSFSDHGRLLATSARYRKAFKYTADADAFIGEVHRAGYATSPTYAATIRAVMTRYKLYQYNNLPA